MFPIDPSKLPSLRTRKALLVIDPQNDFLDDEGALPIHQPLDLPTQIVNAAQAFRADGVDIIWVRTQFDKTRSIHNEMILTSDLPLGNGPASLSKSRGSRTAASGGGVIAPKCPEGFLSLGPSSTSSKAVRQATAGVEFHPAIQEAVSRRDQVLVKSFYSAFKNDQILRLLRMRFVTELYICGSFTNVGVMATAYDAASHGFAITLVKDCCGYRSSIRHNAAIKQIVELTGCDVLDLEEIPLGTTASAPPTSSATKAPSSTSTSASSTYPTIYKRAGDKPEPATTSSADLADALDSLSIRDKPASRSGSHASPIKSGTAAKKTVVEAEKSKSDDKNEDTPNVPEDTDTTDPTLEIQRSLQNVALNCDATPNLDAVDGQATQHDSTEASPATSSQESRVKESLQSESSKEASCKASSSSMKTQGEALGEGDSQVIFSILPGPLAENIFQKIKDEVQWQRMSHQGGEVPRLVAVQGHVEADGSMPVYRHPSDESPPLLPFSPTVTAIKEVVEKELDHPLNHALIQFYRHGNDYISEHSDKTLDIAKDSFIANVSLGAERTMILRTKRTPKPRDGEDGEDGGPKSVDTTPVAQPDDLKRKSQRAPLPHNSLMRMGLQTNMKWLHGIRQDKRQEREKSEEELAYNGSRISLTFRRIGTFLDAKQTLIWGQGATGKTRDAAHEVINGQTPQAVEMLRAFGRENQLSDFDWDAFYGKGFDVLHITASPRLFLSADPVANMRVQMMLAELGIGYARGSMAPAASSSTTGVSSREEASQVRFVDTDVSRSTVQGEVAIMLYLDRVYGSASVTVTTTPGKPGLEVDMAKAYTRFQQALSLRANLEAIRHEATTSPVRETKATSGKTDDDKPTKPVSDVLATWEVYALEAAEDDTFLASKNCLTLADYAFWPVLHEVVGKTVLSVLDGLPGLKAYYNRVKARESMAKLLAKNPAASGDKKE
ncbi:uncharacterized protein B0I36DRAFT_267168 [Microdochium trichocladiopsis]|uniref:Fe2OG dioxygenase domain-containing protein n=1 Tax=Microdochium trichocladiopsis TaxID=1682393 RepID=A0A9P8Y817_9PEZI|nr:uncharacterized protein B0I36DRAFT_267168 [Microdochium trichocladiopsis]KAH7030696.1 hypothetical protein B0I36DRAFT_267168 [Microdochium trichocladiopsis]